jgi:hypothetical protein
MSTLKRFSEQEENYHRYRARLDYQHEQETIRWEYEQSLAQLAEDFNVVVASPLWAQGAYGGLV